MIATLALVLVLAMVLGMLAHRLHLSPIVGYLLAGILASSGLLTEVPLFLGRQLVNFLFWADLPKWAGTLSTWFGQWAPGSVDEHLVHEFSEIGVILLLFGVGLQFHFKDLLAVWKVAVPGSCICMTLWTLCGALVYWAFAGGAFNNGCILFGICVCVSSTVVLVRVLSDNKMLQTPAGHTSLGWLVVEDIFTIALLVLLPAIFGKEEASVSDAIIGLAWKLPLLVFLIAVVGRKLLTPMLTFVSKEKSGELFTLTVLAVALGIAVLSAKVFGASMEFGAFLSGMVVGQSKFSFRAASDALPMRDAFAVLFFVAVGFGFSLDGILDHWALALATLSLVIIVRPITAYIVIRLLGKTSRLGVVVGSALSQIGEFSFIVASLASARYGLIPPEAANVITGVGIVSITVNAACYHWVPSIVNLLEKRGIGVAGASDADHLPEPREDVHRVIVVGHGPCGEILTRVLRENRLEVVVIEMNIETVKRLGELGIPALHGDARLRSILLMAGVEQAKAIIVTAPAAPAQEIISMARSLNKKIQVMANTTYIRAARAIQLKGEEDRVFSGEAEVALSMMTMLLRNLGATEEQVQRERQETRDKLDGRHPQEAIA